MNSSRTIGVVLVVAGLGLAVIAGLWIASQISTDAMSSGGALVAAGLAFIPVVLLEGFGLYLLQQGGSEQAQQSTMRQQRQLLDIVSTRGQISLSQLALELQANIDDVKSMIYQLVGLQVFSGYINWNENMLYSSDASQLRQLTQCKNCGGEITLAGKGVVQCKYCGTEYFLS